VLRKAIEPRKDEMNEQLTVSRNGRFCVSLGHEGFVGRAAAGTYSRTRGE
jgi:hypothetical protein